MAKEKKRIIRLNNIDGWRPYKGTVLVKPVSKEGATTPGGVIIGFNTETNYGEGKGSHVADLAPTEGEVIALPLIHHSGDEYYIPNELEAGDHVWFSYRGSVTGVEVLVDKEKYILVEYLHMLAARRGTNTHILNGYVLLEEVYEQPASDVIIMEKKKNPLHGIVRYVGGKRDYYGGRRTDEIDLEVGDLVLLRKGAHTIQFERQPYLATFDGGTMYRRVKRSDIVAVLNSFETVDP